MSDSALQLFAISAPGIEPITAEEVRALGVDARAIEGGVRFAGCAELLARANLELRTASRIIVRTTSFLATAFHELERRARSLPWERFVDGRRAVRLRVTCRKSKLYHSDAVAERILGAIVHRLGTEVPAIETSGSDAEEDGADIGGDSQLVIVRLAHDRCTISVDSSGDLLHRRGYRMATGKAPLRETLAAAMLLASRWSSDRRLVDPMCGSGTIPIEATLLARRIPPGLGRSFAFERWPETDRSRVDALRARAMERVSRSAVVGIEGADRDAGAIEAARANAARAEKLAGVEFSELRFRKGAISELPALDPGSYIVTNPPYGVRVGESARLRSLYAALGKVLRDRALGSTLAILTSDRKLEGQIRIPLEEQFRTRNGGIAVHFGVGVIADARTPRGRRRRTAR